MSQPSADPIIGRVVVTVTFTCCRHSDRQRTASHKRYTVPLAMEYVGSDFLLQQLPHELDGITNQILKKVRAWEWRAEERAKQDAKIHHPPTAR